MKKWNHTIPRNHTFSRPSLKGKMLAAFIITAVIPSLLLILFSYINSSHIVKDNAEEVTHSNLQQAESTLNVWVDSYEDILFQIYMNDDIVDMVDAINQGKDTVAAEGQLRRTLRGMFYTKEHIKCITVITESGQVIFYDLLTGSATKTSWMGSIGMGREELYDYFSEDNGTRILPTKKAGDFAADTYYLFHLGHRIIDYQNVDKQLGVVIVSVDEAMLQEICGNSDHANHFNFMVDTSGDMISCYQQELLGTRVIEWSDDINVRKDAYLEYLEENDLIKFDSSTLDVVYDEEFHADIVNVSSQRDLIQRLNAQQKILLLVLSITVGVLLILIFTMTRNLMSSINRLTANMEIAGKGELSIRAAEDPKTPTEIQMIETQFNRMMDRLEDSIEKEKDANERQRNAEIAMLEAQINPHFIYNTLDTINWMAIDKEEYDISNSITSLASILRYGIDNSNGVVYVKQEIDWLKDYLFLQQMRLANTFECEIHVAPEVLEWKIHKLLFQPFIENSIFHGFQDQKEIHSLKIDLKPQENRLKIRIWDNGRGIEPQKLWQINQGIFTKSGDKNHIGMENAITRIKMYYGGQASVRIESILGEYTNICILIPKVVDDR